MQVAGCRSTRVGRKRLMGSKQASAGARPNAPMLAFIASLVILMLAGMLLPRVGWTQVGRRGPPVSPGTYGAPYGAPSAAMSRLEAGTAIRAVRRRRPRPTPRPAMAHRHRNMRLADMDLPAPRHKGTHRRPISSPMPIPLRGRTPSKRRPPRCSASHGRARNQGSTRTHRRRASRRDERPGCRGWRWVGGPGRGARRRGRGRRRRRCRRPRDGRGGGSRRGRGDGRDQAARPADRRHAATEPGAAAAEPAERRL